MATSSIEEIFSLMQHASPSTKVGITGSCMRRDRYRYFCAFSERDQYAEGAIQDEEENCSSI